MYFFAGVTVEVRQKRIIKIHFGPQAYLQDVILMDKHFQIVILTSWNTFCQKRVHNIIQNLGSKPIIWARNIKVSSFHGKLNINIAFLYNNIRKKKT